MDIHQLTTKSIFKLLNVLLTTIVVLDILLNGMISKIYPPPPEKTHTLLLKVERAILL